MSGPFLPSPLTKTGQRYVMGETLFAALMTIVMNGPDIEAVDEVKALILKLESVNAWKNYKKGLPSRSRSGVTRLSRSAQGRAMFTLNSRDLRMWLSMISSKMISFQKVMVKSRQVLHPFLTL